MRSLLTIIMLSLISFGASGFEKPRSHFCRPNSTNISCRLELVLVCGADFQDGCLTGQTSVHKCVLQPVGPSCREPVQLLCISGLKDGCDTGRSNRHQCVPYIGPSCDSDAEFSCPTGFQDTCN